MSAQWLRSAAVAPSREPSAAVTVNGSAADAGAAPATNSASATMTVLLAAQPFLYGST
jgi:hypothetical protein